MVVDDEDAIRDGLSQVLMDEGYHVSTSVDGRDALEKLSHHQYDLVLLDIKMPKIDGYEVLAKIRTEYHKTKVIMVTGHADLTEAMKSKQMGADDFIGKPFDVDDVLMSVRRSLNREA